MRSERRESCNPEHLLERQEQNLEIRCHGAFSDQCCGVCLKIQCRMDTLHPTIFARHCTSSARPAEGEGQTYDVEKTIALVRTFSVLPTGIWSSDSSGTYLPTGIWKAQIFCFCKNKIHVFLNPAPHRTRRGGLLSAYSLERQTREIF